MKTRALVVSLFVLSAFSAPAFAGNNAVEQALRNLDAEWCRALAAHDVDKTVSYYSDDAIVLPSNAPMANTKEAIRNIWKGMSDTPGMSLTWQVSRVEVSASGDMAYVSGTYEMTLKNDKGPATNDRGKYLEVWKKQPGGAWKCGADIWNSDLPATPPVDQK